MDANKLKKLRVINYKIGTCGLCKHGTFNSGDRESYGSCGVHTYNHLKHTDNPRQLSVYWYGYCHDFDKDDKNYRTAVQEGYEEFIEKPSGQTCGECNG